MKTSLFVALLLVAPACFAAPIFCSGGNWQVVTDSHLEAATITYNEESVQFGDLVCKSQLPQSGPDAGKAVLFCKTRQEVADAGFEAKIYLQVPGVDMKGTLTKQTFAGPRKVTDLNCVGAAD